MSNKPRVRLVGEDGNVFAIVGRVAETLRRAGLRQEAKEFSERALRGGSYGEVLRLVGEYCEVR